MTVTGQFWEGEYNEELTSAPRTVVSPPNKVLRVVCDRCSTVEDNKWRDSERHRQPALVKRENCLQVFDVAILSDHIIKDQIITFVMRIRDKPCVDPRVCTFSLW